MAKDVTRTKGLKSLKRAAAAIAAAQGGEKPAEPKAEKPPEPPKAEPVAPPPEDGDLFAQAMAEVQRLPPDRRGDRVRARPLADGWQRQEADTRAGTLSDAGSAGVPDEEHKAAFVGPGVDRRELRKLKRGDYDPGDTLDVHGMTAAEALAAVRRFLDRSRARHRCVAIIHGRGLRSPGNVAVLKTRVRACLREHRLVLAFSDAPPDAGGPGAVYVLLRR
jgi:DNA-nicking Smr family endonuclease